MSKNNKTRNLNQKDAVVLYALSAGRCNICNRSLVEHELTQTRGNFGQMAHIVDHSQKHGVRSMTDLADVDGDVSYNRVIDTKNYDTSGLDNIILLCHLCHWDADKVSIKDWPIEKLRSFKKTHETRVSRQTEASKGTVVVEYYSMIDDFDPRCSSDVIRQSLSRLMKFPQESVKLGECSRSFTDAQNEFWKSESSILEKHVLRGLDEYLENEHSNHFSVFAMATQPLLVKLGSIIGNKKDVKVYPRNRDEENMWGWYNVSPSDFFVESVKSSEKSTPIITVEISGKQSMSEERIKDYLKIENADFFRVKASKLGTGNEWAEEDNQNFGKCMLKCLDETCEKYGNTPTHLFMACPNHFSVELGRYRLSKVHPPLIIHDWNKHKKGWSKAITID